MIVIRGSGSTTAQRLCDELLPPDEEVIKCKRHEFPNINAERYLFCQGMMKNKRLIEHEIQEINDTFKVNTWDIMDCCERILDQNSQARICIIGSESGISGSFNQVYMASKAAIHKYIKTRKVGEYQQLIGIAPWIIGDSGMTERREDKDNLNRKRMESPKGRFLKAIEVARLVYFCLYVDEGYLNNTVIRMNGGVR